MFILLCGRGFRGRAGVLETKPECSQKDHRAHKMKRKPQAEPKGDEELPKPVEFKAQNTGQGETAFEYVWRVYVIGYASTLVDHLPIPPPKHEKV